MKIYIRNQQRTIKVNQQKIARLLKKALHRLGLNRAELSILLVNDRRMKILNRQYRGIDRPTDVLSFPQISDFGMQIPELKKQKPRFAHSTFRVPQSEFLLGDIIINLPRAKRQASEQGITLNEELKKLMIHSLLHLIGYDHEESRYQKNRMRSKEKELLKSLRCF